MPALIIIFKILIVAIVALRLYKIIMLFRSDKGVKLTFDLLSTIAIDAVIALTIISLLAKIDETTYVFTLCLCILTVLLNVEQLFRVVIAGDNKIMIGAKTYDFKDIKGMNAAGFTLFVYLKGGKKLKVIVPLTRNTVVRRMKYIK